MWPSPSLSGRPTRADDRLKLATCTETGMSVLLIVSPFRGEMMVSDGLACANACGTTTALNESARALTLATKRRMDPILLVNEHGAGTAEPERPRSTPVGAINAAGGRR